MNDLVLPSEIPWDDLKEDAFEELMYWLMDAMGAKDLEWRKGGKGITASDGGRDIETTFHVPTPDGELEKQYWWIEVKKRSKTLEKSVVQEAIINASNKPNLDVLIIATNTQFSNPTRDWVKEWQQSNPRPKIRLWDRDSIERMLIRHPSVIVRIWDKALSTQGRLEALSTSFWNKLSLMTPTDLRTFWKARKELEWNTRSIISVIASEYRNGSLDKRRWLSVFETHHLMQVTLTYFLNLPVIVLKALTLGLDPNNFMDPLALILIKLLIDNKESEVYAIISGVLREKNENESDSKIYLKYALEPLFLCISSDLQEICQHDCSRITAFDVSLSDKEIENYWVKFLPPDVTDEEPQKLKEKLVMEVTEAECGIGLALDKENSCPVFHLATLSSKENTVDFDSVKSQIETFKIMINCNSHDLI